MEVLVLVLVMVESRYCFRPPMDPSLPTCWRGGTITMDPLAEYRPRRWRRPCKRCRSKLLPLRRQLPHLHHPRRLHLHLHPSQRRHRPSLPCRLPPRRIHSRPPSQLPLLPVLQLRHQPPHPSLAVDRPHLFSVPAALRRSVPDRPPRSGLVALRHLALAVPQPSDLGRHRRLGPVLPPRLALRLVLLPLKAPAAEGSRP